MNPTALLQISDGQTILVVRRLLLVLCPPPASADAPASARPPQIQTASINGNCPPRLKAFLEDPKILKLGVGIMRVSAPPRSAAFCILTRARARCPFSRS